MGLQGGAYTLPPLYRTPLLHADDWWNAAFWCLFTNFDGLFMSTMFLEDNFSRAISIFLTISGPWNAMATGLQFPAPEKDPASVLLHLQDKNSKGPDK